MSSNSALDTVQQLYLLQVELWGYLDRIPSNPDERKKAQKTLREFKYLMKEADPKFMGGEDVLVTLQQMEVELSKKLRGAPVKRAAAKKPTAKKVSKKK